MATRPPRLPRTFIPRRRLWEQLDRATRGPVTALVAPAGAGKTLGVSGWLHELGLLDTLWVNGDASWVPARLTPLLRSAAGAAPAGRHRADPRLLVIDDAHQLPATSIRLLDDRLTNAPDTLRLLLLARWDPPLTRLVPELLGHYEALRGDVLRMDPGEVAELVAAHLGTAPPPVVEAITSHAGGWSSAVVLVARAVAAAPDPAAAARDYARGEARLVDRVASEVFATLLPQDRHVLLCTSGEDVVTASTAVHLSHDALAPETLARLAMTGLLVSPVDAPAEAGSVDPDPSYRIHPLLAEVVRRRLVGGGVDVLRARGTVARAVRLDLARGDSRRAFARVVAVQDTELAEEVLALAGTTLVLRGEAEVATFVARHPDVVEANPDTWFAAALDRWTVDDTEAARGWLDRVLARSPEGAVAPDRHLALACARLMRARLDLRSLGEAVTEAQQTADLAQHDARAASSDLLAYLRLELGASQNWLGDLSRAEANLTATIETCRQRGLTALAAAAASHLALTEYMAGRERAAVEVATESLSLVGSALPRRARFVGTRATLALLLAGSVDLPWPTDQQVETGHGTVSAHRADPCTRFWLRMRDARLSLLSGSTADAERILTTPLEVPVPDDELPRHLRVALLVERAFLAALASDAPLLADLQQQLATLEVPGEAALVAGLRADLAGDRSAAVAAFALAGAGTSHEQPASRATALACEAQLRDALGDGDAALDVLQEAVRATEVRRNAAPFLGWTRQGTPMGLLLATLIGRRGDRASPWAEELASATQGVQDITALVASRIATPRERLTGAEVVVAPALSPREREVLRELARGATYSDIAVNLFVSENTVKTHVSSLYGKLAVSRRSEALAVARTLQLV